MVSDPKNLKQEEHLDAMDRMNKALEEALKMPPKPHKDEPKRGRGGKEKPDG